jgi:hypothetical protein
VRSGRHSEPPTCCTYSWALGATGADNRRPTS